MKKKRSINQGKAILASILLIGSLQSYAQVKTTSAISNPISKTAIPTKEENEEKSEGKPNGRLALAWHSKADDPTLTFVQIAKYCDSLFAVPGNIDTGEDGEYMNYTRWKMFWAPRLDAQSGKLHDFNKAKAAKIYQNTQQKTTSGTTIGETNATDCGKAYSELQANIQTRSSGGTDNTYGWMFIGPINCGHYLGRITSVSVNPSDNTEIYAADEFGGLWKTTNGGNSWACITDNNSTISGIGVAHFDVDYNSSPHKIYISVGYPGYFYSAKFSYIYDATRTFGLFYSFDDGNNWTVVDGLSGTPLNITWIPGDIINDIKVSRDPANPNYVFFTTEYQVARIDVTGMSSTYNLPASIISLFDLTTHMPSTGLSSRSSGFGDMEFLPGSVGDMFVTQNRIAGQQYNTTAKLYHIPNATTSVPGMPIDLTSSILNSSLNVIQNGNFSSPPGAGWILTNPPGSISPVWQYSSANQDMEFNNSGTGGSGAGCFDAAIPGDYMATNYTVSFTVSLPPHTIIDVIMRDPVDPYNTDCDNSLTSGRNIFHLAVATSSPTTYTLPVGIPPSTSSIDNYCSRLVFVGQTTSSYTPSDGNITIDDVSVTTPYFDYINLATTPASGASNLLYVQPGIVTYDFNYGQSYIETFDGSTWSTVYTSGYTDANPGQLTIDALDKNSAYCGDFTGNDNFINKFDLSSGTLTSVYASVLHNDVRCIKILQDPTNPGYENIFIGDDGGLSKRSSFTSISPGTLVDVTSGTTTTPAYCYNGSIEYSVSSSLRNGNIIVGAHDNGFPTSNQSNFNSWSASAIGDGYFTGIGKRNSTNTIQFTSLNGGGGPLTVTGGLKIASTPFQRIKTTINGEYIIGNQYNTVTSTYSPYANIFSYNPGTSSFTNMTSGTSGWPSGSGVSNSDGNIMSFQPDPYDANFFIAYLNRSGFFNTDGDFAVTTNGGSSWIRYPNTTGANFLDIAVDPRTSGLEKRVWAGGAWYLGVPGTGTHRVMVSTTAGHSFTDYSDGLPDGPVNTLLYDEQSHYLFAGTDVGVYARLVDNFGGQTADASWQCFSMNLPNSFITSLEINRCTGKLYASTYGRGLWETELPPNWNWDDPTDAISVDDITGTTPTSWNAITKDQQKSIVIESGATLVISGGSVINMSRDKNITVKQGGALIVDNSTITNSCGSLWGCISVQGVGENVRQNPPSSPLSLTTATGQDGIVILRNGAVIENAYVGVHIGGQYYDGSDSPDYDYDNDNDGGLVYADHTSFHNCVTGIKILPYSHTQHSSFTNCHIYADQYLHSNHYTDNTASTPRRFGSQRGVWVGDWSGTTNVVQGMNFNNCIFENIFSSGFNPDPDLLGVGITALNAGFHVNSCQFNNLTRGIDMSNDGQSSFFVAPFIENSQFNNDWRCASFSNINSVVFQNNSPVTMIGSPLMYPAPPATSSNFDLSPFGVYFSQAQGAWIYKNTIGLSSPSYFSTNYPKMSYGLVLNNTNADVLPISTTSQPFGNYSVSSPNPISELTNTIYKNSISTDAGIAAYQNNTGTQLLCNDLTGSNYRGISVWGTSSSHGLLDNQGSGTHPAGNRFQQPSGSCMSCSSTSSKLDIVSSSVNPPGGFNYNEFTGSGSDPTFTVTCPSCSSAVFTSISLIADAAACATYGTSCCQDLTFGPSYVQFIAKQTQNNVADINSYEYTIDSLAKNIDGGNTNNLRQIINNSSSGDELRKALSSVNYLSDAALIALLNSGIKLESIDLKPVLLKNSKLSQQVWTVFEKMYPLLSKDQDIINAQQNAPGIDDITFDINMLQQKRTVAINAVKDQYIQEDDMNGAATFLAGKQMYEAAMGMYLHNKDFVNARTMCSKIPDAMVRKLDSLYIEHKVSGYKGRLPKDVHDSLTNDEKQVLTEMASNPYTRAGEMARTWLSVAKGEMIMEMMPMDTAIYTSGNISNNLPVVEMSGIVIYPNPAQDQITILNNVSSWNNGTFISVYDVTGRMICRALPTPKTNSLNISTAAWVPGIYLVHIAESGKKEISQKVIIQRQ